MDNGIPGYFFTIGVLLWESVTSAPPERPARGHGRPRGLRTAIRHPAELGTPVGEKIAALVFSQHSVAVSVRIDAEGLEGAMMSISFNDGEPYWVHLTVPDVAAATSFYSELFGWTGTDLGPETGHYTIMSLEGKEVCSIGAHTESDTGPAWIVYFKVSEPHALSKSVQAAGGEVRVAPMDVFDQTTVARFADPRGAVFAVSQPKGHKGAQLWAADGAAGDITLLTHEAGVLEFYQRLFGWSATEVTPGAPDRELSAAGAAAPFGALRVEDKYSATSDVATGWIIDFQVSDADGTAARAQGWGATIQLGPRDVGPTRRQAYLRDPLGADFAVSTLTTAH